jgi:hypothetical protein
VDGISSGHAVTRDTVPDVASSAASPGPAIAKPAPATKPGDYVPDLREVSDDLTIAHHDRCMTSILDSEMRVCRYGDLDGGVTAMLVGDSHSINWMPALNRVAKDRGWRLLVILKAGCRFSATTPGTRARAESCRTWNERVRARIQRNPPDILATMATKTEFGDERLPNGYIEVWRKLDRMGIPVIGIRDTPRASFDRVDCLLAHPSGPATCSIARNPTLDIVSPVLRRDDLPDNLIHVDMTDHLCSAERCPAVVGRVVIYRDRHHLTATFSRQLASRLNAAIPADVETSFGSRRPAAGVHATGAGRSR